MLAQTVREAARRFGERPAFVDADDPHDVVSYRALGSASQALARGLADVGVGPGDVVAVCLPPSPAWPVAYAGVAARGAVTAGVNERLTAEERARVLAAVDPVLVIDDEAQVAELVAAGARSMTAVPDPDPDAHVAICFTSGSTGTPRGAVFGGEQLAAITATDVGDAWGGGGASLGGTTFAHLGPMTKLPGALRRGGTVHLLRRWSPGAALAHTARIGAATVAGIPTQVALMLADPSFGRTDLRSVRTVVVGGGPATPTLVREARTRFGAPVCVRYACTEAGTGLGTAPDDPDEDAELSVGRPRGDVEVRIDGTGDDAVGEVLLRSPARMVGYHRDPAATTRVVTPDGWVRTGDLGWLDDRGRLRLAGRASERYVRGGENVHPQEVEAVLSQHPDVRDVAVIGVPDDTWGEVGVAFVVPAGPPPDAASLRAFASPHLAAFKLPTAVHVVEQLPLGPTHKVDRQALRRQLEPGREASTSS